jgi:predicted RNase H-like HicB family nuclease
MMTTHHVYRGYFFTIEYVASDPAYSVTFPDIPEIITSGDTLPQAFANACEALDLCLESLQKLGQPAPAIHHRMLIEAA